MKRNRRSSTVWLAALVGAAAAMGWHNPGHYKATSLAVKGDDRLPAWFTAGVGTIAHCSLDPDAFTRPIAPPALHKAEAPQQYCDTELLGGAELPPDRYAFIALCAEKGLDPSKVGLLPYSVVEWTQRLTVAFAEHRKWPDNPHIRTKCLVYAGILAHYAEDLCQPLHTTIHYDGRTGKNGVSPRTGIHLKVDALPGKVRIETPRPPRPRARKFENLFQAVVAELRRSHALVDRVYQLEKDLPALEAPIAAGSAVEKFATERLEAAADFTLSLYLTAWEDSRGIELPSWHRREAKYTTSAAIQPLKPAK